MRRGGVLNLCCHKALIKMALTSRKTLQSQVRLYKERQSLHVEDPRHAPTLSHSFLVFILTHATTLLLRLELQHVTLVNHARYMQTIRAGAL